MAPWPVIERYFGDASSSSRLGVFYLLLALCPAIGFVTLMFATRSYSVTADYVKIHLVGGSFSVLMNEIESINRIHWLSTVTGFRFGFG